MDLEQEAIRSRRNLEEVDDVFHRVGHHACCQHDQVSRDFDFFAPGQIVAHLDQYRLRFAVRRGTGGEGRFRGGDGLVRELLFLEPGSLSVLTQHREVAPYGLAGGKAGTCGAQRIERAGGEIRLLGSIRHVM